MIPIHDEQPVEAGRRRRVPYVTLLLIAACIVVFFAVQPTKVTTDHLISPGLELVDRQDLEFLTSHAAIPCEVVKGRPLTEREFRDTFRDGSENACSDRPGRAHSPGKIVLLALLTSMFLHGSPAHLFGNLLFLWVFGNDIEDRWGRVGFLALYVVGGIVATGAHIAIGPSSTIPMIGASGAIAAVMGAYLLCFPAVRIKTMIVLGPIFLRKVKAVWLLLFFLAENLLLISGGSGIAWAAHLGGFAFGALVGVVWRVRRRARSASPPAGSVGPVVAPA